MCITSAPRSFESSEGQRSSAMQLREAFLQDHQVLTRGFRDLLDALERQDDVSAKAIADHLDRAAGAHIDFEEHVYYPLLKAWLGEERIEEMYGEHDVGLAAIRAIADASSGLAPAERARIMDGVRVAFDHAVACGAAVAHLEALDEARQRELLDALLTARERGRRWSELKRDLPDDT